MYESLFSLTQNKVDLADTLVSGIIFGGTLLGFVLARLQWLDIYGRLCPPVPKLNLTTALPSLCYSVLTFTRYKVAIILHLATCLPAAIIAVFQFVPIIRHRLILYHRLAGYAAVLLMTTSLVGACLIADAAMGGMCFLRSATSDVQIMSIDFPSLSTGDIPTQAGTGGISVVIVICFGLAIYNIKCLQIDQHRAWMLRGWIYVGFVITQRILQIIIPFILTRWPQATRFTVISCDELAYLYQPNPGMLEANYPACLAENRAIFAPEGMVPVKGILHPESDRATSTAVINISFAATGQIAFFLHVLFAEIYIALTPREADRLRRVSYQRQKDKGFKNPGSAGLVAQRIGDAEPWMPREETIEESQEKQLMKAESESVSSGGKVQVC
jgi:hypothetical protein